MDMSITIRDGWALVKIIGDGRTALCIPTVTEQAMTFVVMGWHDTYDDAYLAVAAMRVGGVTVDQFRPEPEEGSTDEQQKAQQEITGPQQGGGGEGEVEAGAPVQPASRAERVAATITRASGLDAGVVSGLVTGGADVLGHA